MIDPEKKTTQRNVTGGSGDIQQTIAHDFEGALQLQAPIQAATFHVAAEALRKDHLRDQPKDST